jgi:hypothetical protein
MSAEVEHEIDTCLAYEILRHPEDWLGTPSTKFLQSCLSGAEFRADCVQPDFPYRRVYGVLNEPEFFQPFVDATGHPTLTITWATALAMTHFSLADGFAKLCTEALAWHREKGIRPATAAWTPRVSGSVLERTERFWSEFARRPQMYMGDGTGWTLFCFLTGMDRGGDWLELPPMPRLREIVDRITNESLRHYGSTFAAFRVYNAQDLLEWGGLRPDSGVGASE